MLLGKVKPHSRPLSAALLAWRRHRTDRPQALVEEARIHAGIPGPTDRNAGGPKVRCGTLRKARRKGCAVEYGRTGVATAAKASGSGDRRGIPSLPRRADSVSFAGDGRLSQDAGPRDPAPRGVAEVRGRAEKGGNRRRMASLPRLGKSPRSFTRRTRPVPRPPLRIPQGEARGHAENQAARRA